MSWLLMRLMLALRLALEILSTANHVFRVEASFGYVLFMLMFVLCSGGAL